MADSFLAQFKRAVGFGDADARAVVALGDDLLPHVPEIVDAFYSELLRDPDARAVFTGGAAQMKRQHAFFTRWLTDLLSGEYGEVYEREHKSIGAAHVRAGLPQHMMVTAMELVWRQLGRWARKLAVPQREDRLRSVHKLLMIDLALMLETYRASYTEHVRALERKTVEERFSQTRHLAEVGRLAAALAHEIKNPLAGVSGAIQIIGDAMDGDNPHRPIIREILSQIRRLDATVRDLLLYSRPTPPRPGAFSVRDTVDRILTILREEPALRGVTIRADINGDVPQVRADEDQVEQMLINLVLNAADACAGGGGIRVGASRRGAFVELSVADTGQGMPPDVCASAFDPFFTTKARGTGLGLSICRKIVEAQGGTISLDSVVGRGTTITATLPIAVEDVPEGTR